MIEQSRHDDIRRRSSTITLLHLRYAVASAEHGRFRRAAEVLLLKQSTLSRVVRQLEEAIEVNLFDRSSGGVQATSAGRDFLRVAQSILNQMDALVANAHTSGRGEAGRLAVGFYTSLSAGNLRATLLDFRRRFPLVELNMTETSRSELVVALRNGILDIAVFAGELPLAEIAFVPLWSERILVALPETHELASRNSIYWTDLRAVTILLTHCDHGRELEYLLMTKLVSPSDRPKINRQNVSRGIIKSLICAGFGVSLVTESDVGVGFAGLTYREVRDGTGPSRVGFSAHWSEDNTNPALKSFWRCWASAILFLSTVDSLYAPSQMPGLSP
jgi:DNA-binding transcriptional LysR family regulator